MTTRRLRDCISRRRHPRRDELLNVVRRARRRRHACSRCHTKLTLLNENNMQRKCSLLFCGLALALALPLLCTPAECAPLRVATRLSFAPGTHTCDGGSAQTSLLRPRTHIHCTSFSKTASSPLQWRCQAGMRSLLVRMSSIRISCSPPSSAECTLHYHLDYTALSVFLTAVFIIGLGTLLLALPMYVAVQKFVHVVHQAERRRLLRRARLVKHVSALYLDDMKRDGYGSFGGRLHTLGNYSDSLASILDYDPASERDALRYRQRVVPATDPAPCADAPAVAETASPPPPPPPSTEAATTTPPPPPTTTTTAASAQQPVVQSSPPQPSSHVITM